MDCQNGSASCVLILLNHKDLLHFTAFHSWTFVAILTEETVISKQHIGGFLFFGAAANNKCNLVSRSVKPPSRTGHIQGNPAKWHHSWSNHVATSCILLNLSHWANSFVLRRWHVLAFSCWPGWLLSNSFSSDSGMNTIQITWNQFTVKINEK